jgi:hypothetical protein
MKVFRTFSIGVFRATRKDETAPSPPANHMADAIKKQRDLPTQITSDQLSQGRSPVGPAPKRRVVPGTNPPPSLTDAITQRRK